jgi:hypothetical protein
MRPEDFQHLTLLNADFKLLSTIIKNRIGLWLPTLLNPSQHYGIHGHKIFEAIASVREAICYTECKESLLCILSLDSEEAFDNIYHNYIFHILDNYKFSTLFQRCIRNVPEHDFIHPHQWLYEGQNPQQLLRATRMFIEHAALCDAYRHLYVYVHLSPP